MFTENLTGAPSRGYKVGSIMVGPDDEDRQYLQPNHSMRLRNRKEKKDETENLRDPRLV